MTEERRYGDDEISKIFEAAAAGKPSRGSRQPTSAHGLTLAELKEIGMEVGVAPDRIADAAASLDRRRDNVPARKWLGLPVSAGRTVELPRAPTDREWDMLLGELKQTFRARGVDRSQGGIREWTNGNLHARIEPTETGYRLRLGTVKGNAAAVGVAGVAGLLLAVPVVAMSVVTGGVGENLLGPVLMGSAGASALAWNALRLPLWARERERQMEYIAGRATTMIAGEPKT
jgi:hypothetical protein